MPGAWFAILRPALEQLCAAHLVPLGIAVGWISVESGGRVEEVTSLDERGFFQLMPDESKMLGIDHKRLSVDVSYSLGSGFKLVDYYRNSTRGLCTKMGFQLPDGGEYSWRLTKLAHSWGFGALRIGMRLAAENACTNSWDTFATYLRSNETALHEATRHSPTKWLALVDRMIEIGRPYGVDHLACM